MIATEESTGSQSEARNVLLDVIDRFCAEVIAEARTKQELHDFPCADYFTALKVIQDRWHKEG